VGGGKLTATADMTTTADVPGRPVEGEPDRRRGGRAAGSLPVPAGDGQVGGGGGGGGVGGGGDGGVDSVRVGASGGGVGNGSTGTPADRRVVDTSLAPQRWCATRVATATAVPVPAAQEAVPAHRAAPVLAAITATALSQTATAPSQMPSRLRARDSDDTGGGSIASSSVHTDREVETAREDVES
jgi:hypothetical protein